MAEGLSVKPVRAITWTDVAGREAALIQRCAARDEDACAELVSEHQRMVYQLSLNLLGDHSEALDLSQEVFLRVFRTIHSFRGQSALRTWIYRIVVNQARNRQRWWRRRHRAQQVSLEDHIRNHGELPVGETIAIEHHVNECPACIRELRELRSLGDALRIAAAPGPPDDWKGLQPGVISRMRAEADESWSARAQRLFEDMHLVWIGLASTAATFLCGAVVLSMLHFAAPERNDSLAAVIAVMAAPLGSDLNPARLDGNIRVPSVPENGVMEATLARPVWRDDLVLPLSMVVTREGRVSDVSVLTKDHDTREVTSILDAISRARLEPAQFGGSPVAVSLVWLLAHTTVKGKITS